MAGKQSLRTVKKQRKADDQRGKNPASLANLQPFPKGVSGNPSGRPKLLGESYKAWLEKIAAGTDETNAELVARALGLQAIKGDVSAAREIRAATEGERIRTWRDDVIDLLKAGKVTPADVEKEIGTELASELFIAAGVRRNENGETASASETGSG